MKIEAAPRIMIVATLCALSLIAVVLVEGAARASGQEVLLAMQAVDPRSMLSGHYVQIDLDQTLPLADHCPESQAGGDWIALKPLGNGVYGVAGGAHSRDQTEQIGPVAVKGTFECNEPIPKGEVNPDGVEGSIHINVGIDRFYINQTEAERIANVLNQQNNGPARAFAIVSVGADGQARLKGVEIDGRRLELSLL
jgi:uncharacterized membrane-anchored protein